jgi:hypothetical protein
LHRVELAPRADGEVFTFGAVIRGCGAAQAERTGAAVEIFVVVFVARLRR